MNQATNAPASKSRTVFIDNPPPDVGDENTTEPTGIEPLAELVEGADNPGKLFPAKLMGSINQRFRSLKSSNAPIATMANIIKLGCDDVPTVAPGEATFTFILGEYVSSRMFISVAPVEALRMSPPALRLESEPPAMRELYANNEVLL